MSNQAKLIAWGTQALILKGYKVEHLHEIVVKTPWSTVIRFSNSKDCFYLKQTPPDLFIETEIMKVIHKKAPSSRIPTTLLENRDLFCFLMNSCGDYSLRTKFKGTINPNLLVSGLNDYLTILRSFEQKFEYIGRNRCT